MTIITPYIYLITFKGITQRTLWQIQPGLNKETVEKEMHEAEKVELLKGEKENQLVIKGLPENKALEIISSLMQLMEMDKLYQEHELTLQTLSDKLKLPAYQVSQAINEGMKKNFYDLVNGYRVEEAKRLLLDPKNENYTVLSVGFEAGFNSKTTFNTVFKKFTGVTPSEYRENKKQASTVV